MRIPPLTICLKPLFAHAPKSLLRFKIRPTGVVKNNNITRVMQFLAPPAKFFFNFLEALSEYLTPHPANPQRSKVFVKTPIFVLLKMLVLMASVLNFHILSLCLTTHLVLLKNMHLNFHRILMC